MLVRTIVQVLIFLLAAGCFLGESSVRTFRSPVVPFHELFVLADTIRLDSSILIGQISFLDVSDTGELLVTDDVARSVHLFSATGTHARSYLVPECLPDDMDFVPWSSRFIGDGRILTMQIGGPSALFDIEGDCLVGKRAWMMLVKSFCAREDSIFTHKTYKVGQATTSVFSSVLEAVVDIPIDPPRLVSLNTDHLGQQGRSIDCFDDGAYYVYTESMDAIPVWSSSTRIQYRPDFFEWRPEDLPRASPAERSRLQMEYPSTIAIFALDRSTRMILSLDLDSTWHLDDGNTSVPKGISVASNTGKFPGRSTISPVWPMAAGNGFFYVVGENESLPHGEVGNPVLLKYQFIPPGDTND